MSKKGSFIPLISIPMLDNPLSFIKPNTLPVPSSNQNSLPVSYSHSYHSSSPSYTEKDSHREQLEAIRKKQEITTAEGRAKIDDLTLVEEYLKKQIRILQLQQEIIQVNNQNEQKIIQGEHALLLEQIKGQNTINFEQIKGQNTINFEQIKAQNSISLEQIKAQNSINFEQIKGIMDMEVYKSETQRQLKSIELEIAQLERSITEEKLSIIKNSKKMK